MGAVESASGSEEGKIKDENLVNKGRSEIEQGLAQIKGTAAPPAAAGETGETAGAGTQASEAAKSGDKPQPIVTSTTPGSGVPPQSPTSGTTTQPAQGAVGADEPKSQQTVPDTAGQKQTGQIDTEKQPTQPGSATKSSQMGDQSLVGQGADAPQGPGSSV